MHITRLAVALLSGFVSASAFAVEPLAAAQRRIEETWKQESNAGHAASDRLKVLATVIQNELKIDAPIWWKKQIAATLSDKPSNASPRIKTNATIEERGQSPNHRHVIVMNDGREFPIDLLPGDWEWETEYANVYKHKDHAYVLKTGGGLNPYPVFKVSTLSGKLVWQTEISGLPWVDIAGGLGRHRTGPLIHDGDFVVFSAPTCGTGYAFAIDDATGELRWQFHVDVQGDPNAPLFGNPP
ncbi:PQQ-binding-like beta-propeller repeat protein [Rhodopirellula europaea]|uniref:Secreted protein n=1 Tax=Rhodopirellula europaea 6C TaxID=1263867 RepID=M2AXZ8_9BACT|nr:secreted protein [Rhodopirellula europaea]EMB17567.1 secreted protein [Rhodopirellula europaea 6C]